VSLCLSRDEVAELTGAKTRAGQIRVLRSNGIYHVIAAGGWPNVPRTAIDGKPRQEQDAAPKWKPRKAA
jgi:hypothetical protein